MKQLTVTELARSVHSVLTALEQDQEEVALIRNNRPIARLVPEPAAQNALEVFGDLFDTLDDDTAKSLTDAVQAGRRQPAAKLNSLRNPWAS